jgi:glycosyltransferase involved in cell wall biosynthesis
MKPAVSIITVCRNALPGLQRTRDSVRQQSCRDFEWIIIDGDSTDGTREFLEKIAPETDHVVSEPDSGIYDAMNKGLQIATGERVWFMNAGDTFYDSKSLAAVAAIPDTVDIGFGEVIMMDGDWNELGPRSAVTPHQLPMNLAREQFRRGMVVSHQAFIPLRRICPPYRADRYRFSADLDWMLGILAMPRSSRQLNPLAMVQYDGATRRNWKRSQWERFQILYGHFGAGPALANHVHIALRRIGHARNTGCWK